VGANATKDESKDPENLSFSMPCQGILPKLFSLFLVPGIQNGLGQKSFKAIYILGILRLANVEPKKKAWINLIQAKKQQERERFELQQITG